MHRLICHKAYVKLTFTTVLFNNNYFLNKRMAIKYTQIDSIKFNNNLIDPETVL